MRVERIIYHPDFIKEFRVLDKITQRQVMKAADTFQANPLYPSLRLHQLKDRMIGLWSITVTHRVRIIFSRFENGSVLFESVGQHDIYKHL